MRYLSLFSGIEAATVAWHPLGWECVGVAEIEPFPCQVLKHHYPTVPNLGSVLDITEDQVKALGPIDLVVFGSPCQDLSVAGKRKGLLDENGDATRSGLFFTAINIVHWARRHGGCRFALWENVPGAFSSNKGRDFASVVEWMAGLDGLEVPPKGWGTEGVAVGDEAMVEWATLDAQWFGVAQRRRRVFALADFGEWANRPPILLEPARLRGDFKKGEQARQDVAGTIAARFGVSRNNHEECTVGNLTSSMGQGGPDLETKPMVLDSQVCGTLTAGFGKMGAPEIDAYTAIPIKQVIGAINSAGGHAVPGNSLQDIDAGQLLPIAFSGQMSNPQNDVDMTQTLQAKNPAAVAYPLDTQNMTPAMQARRLTPTECERLQGFPDGYTDIKPKGKPTPDGPRYKALGNSMAVPVMRWIGESIDIATAEFWG